MNDPLILLHGFSQTTASFEPLRTALADHGMATEAVDLPGHGTGSGPGRLVTGDLWTGADEIATDRRGVWLGYSMGARLALHVALAHPEAVTGLVVIGGTAGIDDPAERAARRASDSALADRIERDGLDPFLHDWLANPLFATLPEDPDRIRRRATNLATGVASSLRRWGTGTMDPPLWGRLAEIEAPTLVLAGSLDEKFTVLGHRLAGGIGANARFATVDAAGHAAHSEQPEEVAHLIADWLPTLPSLPSLPI
ncbi:MAG TPA: alpha/beta fold hydrolase [Acidimicrobiales bacterium]|nr:alpha/beta fold hydrolase [Acidimicrobiales bacterium]